MWMAVVAPPTVTDAEDEALKHGASSVGKLIVTYSSRGLTDTR